MPLFVACGGSPLAAEGVEIPCPQQDLRVREVPPSLLMPAVPQRPGETKTSSTTAPTPHGRGLLESLTSRRKMRLIDSGEAPMSFVNAAVDLDSLPRAEDAPLHSVDPRYPRLVLGLALLAEVPAVPRGRRVRPARVSDATARPDRARHGHVRCAVGSRVARASRRQHHSLRRAPARRDPAHGRVLAKGDGAADHAYSARGTGAGSLREAAWAVHAPTLQRRHRTRDVSHPWPRDRRRGADRGLHPPPRGPGGRRRERGAADRRQARGIRRTRRSDDD